MFRKSAVVSSLALVTALASLPVLSGPRAFVASFGSDANGPAGCNLVAPCRTFPVAHTAVNDGGEIVALDAAGYAPVTITKSVTITANPGFYAGIAASAGNAVTIATAGVSVILRGLNLNGTGANNGVVMTNGSRLSIENCVISNFIDSGVDVSTPAMVRVVDSLFRDHNVGVLLSGGAKASISGSKFLGNSQSGVYVNDSTPGATTTAAISDSIASDNWVGFHTVAGNATATVTMSVSRSTSSNNGYGVASSIITGTSLVTTSNSMVTGNSQAGLYQSGMQATHESLGNNTVRQNGSNTMGLITVVGGL